MQNAEAKSSGPRVTDSATGLTLFCFMYTTAYAASCSRISFMQCKVTHVCIVRFIRLRACSSCYNILNY
ncbi:uncharacterized protein BDV17DRAFT_269191 [Aspergillus undulatus]|uniref:uncharacterized protein n=1 Tax=Aspergillus undulatus TaxID=1810928 RepID=UPI003CCCD883